MYAIDLESAVEESWDGMPFRALLPAAIGAGLEIYQLTVTHANPHVHDDYDQVYIIESGRGTMQIGDEHQVVGPGHVIHIPRGQRHALAPLDESPVKLYSIIHHLTATG